ncbi:MAG: efflux RND transporter periplasmic adaptor subunit [Planctomycetaceae bacterium]
MNGSSRTRTHVGWEDVVASALSWVTSIATVAALAAVGWYGHATHWTFGVGGGNHGDHGGRPPAAATATVAGDVTPADAGPVIRFESRAALDRSGIELVPVRKRAVVSELVAPGVVAYDERRIAQLSTRLAGSVWRVERHLGDQVRKGDVLLVIESRDVGDLKAEFLNALVAFETRREQLAILEELKTAIMGRQVREARAALREARNHLTNAEQALVNLGFEISAAEYDALDDAERANRIRVLGLPPGMVAGLDADRLTSNLLPLYAPFTGVVVGREAVVGEVVEPSKPIFEVADVSTMLLVLNVSKEDAAAVAIGQPVRFRPDGSDAEFASRITWISTEVDESTRTLQVRAEVAAVHPRAAEDAPAVLRANTFGTGRIEIGRRDTAVLVPKDSVQWDGRRWVVFVPRGETAFEPRPVEPGVHDDGYLEVCGPVTSDPGFTQVVGGGSHVLKSQILLDRMDAEEL